jgi:hypothetical protein
LAEWNKAKGLFQETKFCNPKVKKPRLRHLKHKAEKSKDLPQCLRKHFDSYFQICRALGCEQGEPGDQVEMFEDEE